MSKQKPYLESFPNQDGFFGAFGGAFIPPQLEKPFQEINEAYEKLSKSFDFINELKNIRKYYQGRPTPISYCRNLSNAVGGGQIYLKREDLNHTGAHKLNHCMAEALLAKYLGKKKLIAETGAGQHGVALATACALVGIPCEIHMGQVDIEKEHPNVVKMKILGATLISVTRGTATLKDAVDSAFEEYLKDPTHYIYAIGSVVGPHPFPMMVRDFQSIIGKEIKAQTHDRFGANPDYVVACVGGGSNAMGAFTAFLNDVDVKLIGVEPAGHGLDTDMHSATLTLGKPSQIHGMACYVLENDQGEPLPVHSIASGLDYPGVGPQHSLLKDLGRVEYTTATDQECLDAFMRLSRVEGIVPALESSHAVAWVLREAPKLAKDIKIVVNVSGRGDKDADYVAAKLGLN